MTSAQRSPRVWAASGPATTRVMSITRTPANASAILASFELVPLDSDWHRGQEHRSVLKRKRPGQLGRRHFLEMQEPTVVRAIPEVRRGGKDGVRTGRFRW